MPDSNITKKALAEAMKSLMAREPFTKISVGDICAECGITKPTFYHYVPSKDDILLRYNEEALDTVEAHVAGTDPEGPVSQLLGAYLVLIDECERIGPDLKERGLIFVGIDVIGDYLTEINVTSPTGIRQVRRFGGADIAALIWDAIEARR